MIEQKHCCSQKWEPVKFGYQRLAKWDRPQKLWQGYGCQALCQQQLEYIYKKN